MPRAIPAVRLTLPVAGSVVAADSTGGFQHPIHLAAVGALLFVGVAFLAFPPYQTYCESNDANDYDCAAYGVAMALGTFIDAHAGSFTVIATVAIAYFTLALRRSTDNLWGATRRTADIAENLGKRQSRETEILQRAYISAEPEGVSPFLPRDPNAAPTNKNFVGHVGFRNAGRLPARNVKWYLDSECSTDPEFVPSRYGELIGNNVISPGESMTQGSIEVRLPDDYRGVYCYVWGKVTYDDGFGNERKTIFCHRYNLRRLERGKGPNAGFFRVRARYGRHHDKGNDAD